MIKLGFGRIIRPEGATDGPPAETADGRAGRGASVVEVGTLEEAVAVALL
jgi:hypothetical protein